MNYRCQKDDKVYVMPQYLVSHIMQKAENYSDGGAHEEWLKGRWIEGSIGKGRELNNKNLYSKQTYKELIVFIEPDKNKRSYKAQSIKRAFG